MSWKSVISPPPQPKRVNLEPSPSPPPVVPLPNARKDRLLLSKLSYGDAVLVSSMDNGRVGDISREAEILVLASNAEADSLQRRTRNRSLKGEAGKKFR